MRDEYYLNPVQPGLLHGNVILHDQVLLVHKGLVLARGERGVVRLLLARLHPPRAEPFKPDELAPISQRDATLARGRRRWLSGLLAVPPSLCHVDLQPRLQLGKVLHIENHESMTHVQRISTRSCAGVFVHACTCTCLQEEEEDA